MRIGIDARLIEETGIGRYIRNLLQGLATLDRTNTYIVFVYAQSGAELVPHQANIEVRIVPVRWHTLKEQLILPIVFLRERLDILHVPYFTIPLLYYRPFVVTMHDVTILHQSTGKATTLHPFFYWLRKAGYRVILSLGLKRAKIILAVSETTKAELVTALMIPSRKIRVLYEGIDIAISQAHPGKRPILERYFLYVGNAYPHKNLTLLINALQRFRSREGADHFSDVRIICVGKDDFFYRRFREEIHKLRLDHEVRVVGQVTDTELATWYTHAEALLYPSLSEGFGLPPLEALACRCPVVVLNLPIFRELIHDWALLLPNDPTAWAEAMQQIVLHHKEYEVAETLRRHIVTSFSWEKMVRETHHIYEEISCGV